MIAVEVRAERDEETVREEVVTGGAAEVAADTSKEDKGERGGESERTIGRDEEDPESAGIEAVSKYEKRKRKRRLPEANRRRE